MKVGDLVQYLYIEDGPALGIIIKGAHQQSIRGISESYVEVHWYDDNKTTYEHVKTILNPDEDWIWVVQ